METVVLDGMEYVKASRAAKDLGYTADHVGQLCRSGKVNARLVGRAWYVLKDDLVQHKAEKKRILRAKAREQAKKSIEEHRKSIKASESDAGIRTIRYEADDSELIPQTRKIRVSTPVIIDAIKDAEEVVVADKDEKIADAAEQRKLEEVEKLTYKPNINHGAQVRRVQTKKSRVINQAVRLPASEKSESKAAEDSTFKSPSSGVYYVSSALMYLAICTIMVFSMGTAWSFTYVNDGKVKSSHRISWSFDEVIESIRL